MNIIGMDIIKLLWNEKQDKEQNAKKAIRCLDQLLNEHDVDWEVQILYGEKSEENMLERYFPGVHTTHEQDKAKVFNAINEAIKHHNRFDIYFYHETDEMFGDLSLEEQDTTDVIEEGLERIELMQQVPLLKHYFDMPIEDLRQEIKMRSK